MIDHHNRPRASADVPLSRRLWRTGCRRPRPRKLSGVFFRKTANEHELGRFIRVYSRQFVVLQFSRNLAYHFEADEVGILAKNKTFQPE
jgi:hypothetical protein